MHRPLLEAVKVARRPAIFALVGCLNTSIDFGVFAILTEFVGIHPLSANVVSFLMGATNSLVMNGQLTFRGKGFVLFSTPLLLRFTLVTAACLGASSLALALALPLVPNLVAKAFSILVSFSFGYIMYSRFVYIIDGGTLLGGLRGK
jgi:putative flippase GtrA